uniref:Cux N-terminal domain-containing protein n=1 Tax=Fagus sylvatica TaxID=28930 RepID=A0A2N9HJX6_FAGSY
MEPPQSGGSERDKPNSSSSSPTPVVANFWKDFDLEKEKAVLDEQGLRIAENQENSQKNRRKLAESTRDFKKASAEEKLSLFNSLLKGYQEEVDNITKRAKFGENAFLNIYQKLYEAPDPYPALASIAEQDLKLSELESENRKMKVELEEFRTEATHLKNQQATIRRLEERNRQLELQMEDKVKETVEMKQRSLAEENQKTLEVLKEREESLQDQLRQAKESISTMHKLHELAQSQLFELRAQSDEDRAAKQSELNLLMDEVERAQTRLHSLEREKGHLRSQLQTANEDAGNKKSLEGGSSSPCSFLCMDSRSWEDSHYGQLRKRRICIVDWCCMCKHSGESPNHLLLQCETAQSLWSMVFCLFGVIWVMPGSVVEVWLVGWGRSVNPDMRTLGCCSFILCGFYGVRGIYEFLKGRRGQFGAKVGLCALF